jgi:hypothetical protein
MTPKRPIGRREDFLREPSLNHWCTPIGRLGVISQLVGIHKYTSTNRWMLFFFIGKLPKTTFF